MYKELALPNDLPSMNFGDEYLITTTSMNACTLNNHDDSSLLLPSINFSRSSSIESLILNDVSESDSDDDDEENNTEIINFLSVLIHSKNSSLNFSSNNRNEKLIVEDTSVIVQRQPPQQQRLRACPNVLRRVNSKELLTSFYEPSNESIQIVYKQREVKRTRSSSSIVLQRRTRV